MNSLSNTNISVLKFFSFLFDIPSFVGKIQIHAKKEDSGCLNLNPIAASLFYTLTDESLFFTITVYQLLLQTLNSKFKVTYVKQYLASSLAAFSTEQL